MINKNLHFCVESQRLGKYRTIKISNTKNGEFIEIIPEVGGLINDIRLRYNDQLLSILDGYSSGEELNTTLKSTYKGSYLFPFPNRIKDGVYRFNDKEYHADINFPEENNSIHGLVYDCYFEVRDIILTENEAKVKIKYISDGSHKSFPFKYEIRLEYTIDSSSNIKFLSRIRNKDTHPILFGDGWHPYFKTGSEVDKLELMLITDFEYEVDNRMIPTGSKKPYNEFNSIRKINKTHFDTCYSVPFSKKNTCARLIDKEKNIGFNIWFEGYKYVQVYTPIHRNTIAIEPMTCIPDAFNNKIGILYLPPEEEKVFSWGVNKLNI